MHDFLPQADYGKVDSPESEASDPLIAKSSYKGS